MDDTEKSSPNIGEKLLKEPIWIGLIVILNLILFFCISYVIRRKCGNRISDLMSTRKKSTVAELSKETKTDSPSLDHSILPTYIESPTISTITRPKRPDFNLRKTLDDGDLPSSTNISIPTTPIITDYNSQAAMRLFAAYNTELQHDPNFSQINTDRKRLTSETREDFMSCGFQGGTISFSDEDDIPREVNTSTTLNTKSLGRSKSSTIPSYEEYERKIKRVFTYPDRHSPNGASITGTGNTVHCYPEIRIVNEFNEECGKTTDSDRPLMDSPGRGLSSSKSLCNEDVPISNTLEAMDSGYPSTSTVSSNTTQCSVPQEGIKSKHTNLTASDRRKQFGSKAKSTSFYKLSAQTLDSENCDISSHCVTSQDSNQNHGKRRLESAHKLFRSYDVNPVCVKCNDNFKARMTSFSCENDLDKIRRYDSVQHCCKKHDCCRRHQRRVRKCSHKQPHCDGDHVTRHGNYRNVSRYTSPTSRYLSLSEIRDIRRNHKRAIARLSSTESEGYLNEPESFHRRRAYCSKEHYSDGCLSYMANRRHQGTQDQTGNWNVYMNDPFKSQMMQSFLSDTYNSNVHDVADALVTAADVNGTYQTNLLLSPQYSITNSTPNISKTSIDSSKSVSPSPECWTNNQTILSKSNTDSVEVPATALDESCDTDDVLDVVKTKVQASDSLRSVVKDSAYQTKQSSMDNFTTSQPIADILDSIEAITDTCQEDKESADSIRRYLQQAALKLALLKRLQGPKQGSRDSAIQTFSEDEMSIEDETRKSYGKRTGAFLAMQMKELKLSQVKEEHSTQSRETDSQNTCTPTNELQTDCGDKLGTDKLMETSIINRLSEIITDDSVGFQETIV